MSLITYRVSQFLYKKLTKLAPLPINIVQNVHLIEWHENDQVTVRFLTRVTTLNQLLQAFLGSVQCTFSLSP